MNNEEIMADFLQRSDVFKKRKEGYFNFLSLLQEGCFYWTQSMK